MMVMVGSNNSIATLIWQTIIINEIFDFVLTKFRNNIAIRFEKIGPKIIKKFGKKTTKNCC